jgi:hypothetical protein
MNSSLVAGKAAALNWPPRSPDLSRLDYRTWGHMKNVMYERTVEARDEVLSEFLVSQDMLITLQSFIRLRIPQ